MGGCADHMSQPNPDQAALWTHSSGQVWVELQALMDRLYQPIEDMLVDRAFPGVGGRVLDIGCGAGATTLAMARRLGPTGVCLGVDVSAPLVAAARARAAAQDLNNARFVEADAQTHDPGAERFDAIVSRFGVMFFADFDAAFANLRRSARPGAGLVFVCWRGPADNPLAHLPMQAAAPLLPPQPEPDMQAPGRFAFADPGRVRGILARTGWHDVVIEPLDVPTPIALDELITMSMKMGPVTVALRDQSDAVRSEVERAVRTRLAEEAEHGVVKMVAACWLVTASA